MARQGYFLDMLPEVLVAGGNAMDFLCASHVLGHQAMGLPRDGSYGP